MVLSLTWESPYLRKTVFILRWVPGDLSRDSHCKHNTARRKYCQSSSIRHTKSSHLNVSYLVCSCLCPIHWSQVQSSAVITRSNIVRYCINNHRNWGRISIRCWIHNRHPIARPGRRAMGCLLLIIFYTKNFASTSTIKQLMLAKADVPVFRKHCKYD